MSLSLATLISIHSLSQIIGGGDCGLSAYLFRAGSVSIPLLIQIEPSGGFLMIPYYKCCIKDGDDSIFSRS